MRSQLWIYFFFFFIQDLKILEKGEKGEYRDPARCLPASKTSLGNTNLT